MSRANLVRLVLLAGMWGSSFLLIKFALEGLSPIQIVLGRIVTGCLVLLVIVATQRRKLPREPDMWAHLALLAVVSNIIPFFLFGYGEQRITSGLAGALNGTTPLFTLGFAVLALPEERLTVARVAGFVIGFAGVLLIVGPWDENPLTSSIPGQLACLGASLCYGIGFTYTRRFVSGRGYPPPVVAAVQLICGSVILGALSPVVARGPVDLSAPVVVSVLFLGATSTGLAYLLFHRLVMEGGATSASMVTYLVPVVAVVLGVVALGEPITWNLLVGAAVVVAGVAIAEGRVPWVQGRVLAIPDAGAPPPEPPSETSPGTAPEPPPGTPPETPPDRS